jgi:hypothetical protein
MNWTDFINAVMGTSDSDEYKAFFLGVGLAAGVRIVRAGIRWVKRIDSDT